MRVKTVILILLCGFMMACICNKSTPVEPEEVWVDPWEPYIHPELVEDTNRVWLNPDPGVEGDTLVICPKKLYVRYVYGALDTIRLWEILNYYHLRPESGYFGEPQKGWLWYYEYVMLITDDRRAEYHFTPYHRGDDFHNFGSGDLVDIAFGVFDEGDYYPTGELFVDFKDGTPESRIDSLLYVHGLIVKGILSDYDYRLFITKKADRNVIDLVSYLNHVPFIENCWIGKHGSGGTYSE